MVEDLKLVPPGLQCVDNPVLLPRADLHQADETGVCSEIVVFQIDSNLLGRPQLLQHLQNTLISVHPSSLCSLDWLVHDGLRRLVYPGRILQGRDLGLVRVLVLEGATFVGECDEALL